MKITKEVTSVNFSSEEVKNLYYLAKAMSTFFGIMKFSEVSIKSFQSVDDFAKKVIKELSPFFTMDEYLDLQGVVVKEQELKNPHVSIKGLNNITIHKDAGFLPIGYYEKGQRICIDMKVAKLIEYVFYLFLFYKNVSKVCDILKEEGIKLSKSFAENVRSNDSERYKVACILCDVNYGGLGSYPRIVKSKDWSRVQELLIEEVISEEKNKVFKKMYKNEL